MTPPRDPLMEDITELETADQITAAPPPDALPVDDVRRDPVRKPDAGASNRRTQLALTSIGDLLAEPDEQVNWLVEDRIPAGGIVVIAAKPKVGKSTTVRNLALSVARGGDWLGHRCHTGVVWYLAFEGRRRDIRAHFRQMGAQTSDTLRIFVGQAPADVVARVRQLAEAERPALIIIDTMQRFLRAESTDDYAEMTSLFDVVIGIAQKSGATIALLHHSGKGDRAGLDAVLGSTAIAGSADTIVLLSRTARFRTISTVQRVGDDLTETVILLDEATGRVRLGGTREEADQRAVADAILAALAAAKAPLTEPQVAELVDARLTLQRRALRDLVVREQVSRTGKGGKGSPFFYSVTNSCSLVPSIEREQENNNPRSQGSRNEPKTNACSLVREQAASAGEHFEASDPSDCPVCGRDSCDDFAACARQHSKTLQDLEEVCGPLGRVERVQ